MPKLSPTRLPKYSLHKRSGRAVVYIDGKEIPLGKYGSPESREKYDAKISEWQANHRRLPSLDSAATIMHLVDRFRDHALAYYRLADGTPSGEWENYRLILHRLVLLYGRTPAAEFGPDKLEALMAYVTGEHEIIDQKTRKRVKVPGWSRPYINRQMGRIRKVFRFAVAKQIVPPSILEALKAVEGLRRGRTAARETGKVKPVPPATIDATLPFLSRQLQAVVKLQLLTGARGGELLAMRPCDIDMTPTSADTRAGCAQCKPGRACPKHSNWTYRPAEHKNAHRGIDREIRLGPQAQKLIEPFLAGRATTAYLFSPAEADIERRAARHAARKVKAIYGNAPGTNRKARPKRKPGERYDSRSYGHAVMHAAKRAGVPHWHPHQIRHLAATRLRQQYGYEAASVILGHTYDDTTAIYAEKDVALAERVMSEVG